ncbi:MAG: RagB/SusD family nutrient uptake outer membrane protein, partial [Fermentimonas sp.]|nr:RagB/SusD family nutrient uptake outer membrane protein [Fermentimonas sp.]
MKKIILYTISLLFLVTSCDLDYFPSDALTPEQLSADPGGAIYITEGNYSMFKDEFEYKGLYSSGNTYIRHYMQMTEYPSDNVTLSGRTTDPLYEAAVYRTTNTMKNVSTVWWLAYRIILGTNSVIGNVQDGASVESDHLKGENYFMRAITHLHLVTLYAKPYSQGRENQGVILRTSTDTSESTFATVGEVYDQIVADLKEAIRLMSVGSRRGNAGFASKEAAQGLLSRVYLYMGMNQEVVDIVNEMLDGASPDSKLEPTASFPGYFANALTSKETLWAIAHTSLESMGQSSIASMYLNDGMGWGEVFSADPLNDLYERYPQDIRYSSFVIPKYDDNSSSMMISWPVESDGTEDFRSNELRDVELNTSNKYFFTEGSQNITVETEIVNGYPQNYIMWEGSKHKVRLTPKMQNRNSFPLYYISKFSYQDGNPMLSSPVMIRWAEVILNRAEAYAKLNMNAEALADVNVIR